MRYALISDVHANLPALEAVLTDIATHARADATYHLGDLVGYAPWPDEDTHSEHIRVVATRAARARSRVQRFLDPSGGIVGRIAGTTSKTTSGLMPPGSRPPE